MFVFAKKKKFSQSNAKVSDNRAGGLSIRTRITQGILTKKMIVILYILKVFYYYNFQDISINQ